MKDIYLNLSRSTRRLLLHQMVYLTLPALCLLTVNGCTNVFFQPMRPLIFSPDRIHLRYENVYIPVAGDVTLHGWYLPAVGTVKGTVLFLHGNAENISTHLASVFWMPDAGYNVLLYDYRGYGHSGGKVGLDMSIADVHKVIDYLRARPDIDTRKLVVFGQSLGAVIAINAIRGKRDAGIVSALIADSPFTSFRSIAREKLDDTLLFWPLQLPLSLLITGSHNPVQRVKDVAPIPLLVVHGTADHVIPFHHGKSVFDAAGEPKTFWEIPNGTHIRFPTYPGMRKKLIAFLDALQPPQSVAK